MSPFSRFLHYAKVPIQKCWAVLVVARIAFIGVTFVLAMAVVNYSWSNNATRKEIHTTKASVIPPVLQTKPEQAVTILVLQLRNGGFVPREITRRKGNYELLITNISEVSQGVLQLERETGEHVSTIPLIKGRNVRKLVHLDPDNYFLRVGKYRNWLTRITITED